MTLAEILADEDLRRHEFPVAQDKMFLAHAGVCPLPRRVVQAISDYAAEAATADQEQFVYPTVLDDGRKLAAQLLHCQPEEIAFVGPTSLALSFIASGLKFRRSDNILIYFDDYPSNVYPWMALAEQGVEVRLMNTRGLGVIRPADVMGQVDENTRLVALASCHFISGYRIDLPAIGKFLRERNILFCVDGIQTLGAFPTTVEHVDMLAADAHKWLLGPCGAGLLYVRREVQERINPPLYGWHNVRCPDFVAQEQIVFRKDARKYEAGTHNLLGVVGLMAALELILEVGVENIAARTVAQTGVAGRRRCRRKATRSCTPTRRRRPPAASFRFIPARRRSGRRCTRNCRSEHHHLLARGSRRQALPPALAAFLQHGRGTATRGGIAVRLIPESHFQYG